MKTIIALLAAATLAGCVSYDPASRDQMPGRPAETYPDAVHGLF